MGHFSTVIMRVSIPILALFLGLLTSGLATPLGSPNRDLESMMPSKSMEEEAESMMPSKSMESESMESSESMMSSESMEYHELMESNVSLETPESTDSTDMMSKGY